MVECIFSLGLVDKKLLLPFLMSLNQVILNLITYSFEENNMQNSDLIDALAVSIGELLIAIIPYIFKYKSQVPLKEAIFNKKNIKYQAILWVFNIVIIIVVGAPGFLTTDNKLTNPHTTILYTREAGEMIFLTIITAFF